MNRECLSALVVLAMSPMCSQAQLELTPDSYVFFLQDTSDGAYVVRAFDAAGDLYSELRLNVPRTPVYSGFATVGNRIFAITYPEQMLVEFDSITGNLIASHEVDEPELIIGLDSDQTDLYLNGFNEWTGAFSTSGQWLEDISKPTTFGGGGSLAIFEDSFFYFDESTDSIIEADRWGNVLDTINLGFFMAIPDSLDYDPAVDEFLLSGHGVVWRYDRQGQLVSELILTGFGSSFHAGFEFHPTPIPAPGALSLAAVGFLVFRIRPVRPSG